MTNSLEGFPLGIVAWLALVPLHALLVEITPKQGFFRGWFAGTIAFIGTMYWVVIAMHLYGQMPLLISVAVMLLLAVYLGLYVGVYALAYVWVERRRPSLAWIAAPCFWVALEFLRTYALSGLPWGLLGYSQFQWLPIIQIADITSVYGVSFLIVLVNVALFHTGHWLIPRKVIPRNIAKPWLPLAVTLPVFLLIWTYGEGSLLTSISKRSQMPTLDIGIVQPNIDQAQKWDVAYRLDTMERYTQLTQLAAKGSDLILWPESATPFVFEQEPTYQSLVKNMVVQGKAPLVFGSPLLQRHTDGRPYLFNSAYLLDASGNISGRYDKQHLVPFGEYIPLRTLLFFLDKLVVGIGDFESGNQPTLLSIQKSPDSQPVRFGVAICFEVVFPNLVRQLANAGANFLITLTNDAWFGDTVAPSQHFAMVVFRAVENRMAFARAANTGISGFIDPTGHILAASPIFTEQALTGRIPLTSPSTFYTRFGDMFAWGCVIISLILLLFLRFFPTQNAIDTVFQMPSKHKGEQNVR
ncbi:MAG: apolipoprotein N-acyltransferase [Nitrospirota bacterium]|nr:apolipoprotein N-acyltransferase [Nitrospirota bacterium]